MKGQKLVVRWSASGDQQAIARIYAADRAAAPSEPPGGRSAVAKLAGDVVAHAMLVDDGARVLRLECLYVAAELRGNRIGRLFVQELSRLASADGMAIVPGNESLLEFFRRIGFDGPAGLLRPVNEPGAGV